MTETKYIVKPTTQFKKDYKLAVKRGLKIDLLKDIIAALAMGEELPEKNRDHALTGNWVGHRECHILPDWLLSTPEARSSSLIRSSITDFPLRRMPVRTFTRSFPMKGRIRLI